MSAVSCALLKSYIGGKSNKSESEAKYSSLGMITLTKKKTFFQYPNQLLANLGPE